jgi:hypothetical protein
LYEEGKQCKVCGIGYMTPTDNRIHASRHTEFLRKARIASRYAKKNSELFASNAEEAIIVCMIGLGDSGYMPKDIFHQEEPLYLRKNICSFVERDVCMDDLWTDGFATVEQKDGRWFYRLTYKGFEALAGWLDRDLICLPAEK